ENASFCKPNPKYYEEIVTRLGLDPKTCLMVGNDVTEDGAAKALGMDVFFLTDCLINKEEKDIDREPHGSFAELEAFLGL
ncbi:MAG: HAD hydrolase-like protein, partial [Ruminiclostridium sp.]|nr:HAD hydrolase-like protein [Ruminiclostridium sp.]